MNEKIGMDMRIGFMIINFKIVALGYNVDMTSCIQYTYLK